MRIPLLQHLSNRRGPFVTVSVDVTRTDESAAREIELRWQELRRSATNKGVPEKLLIAIGETLLVPTGLSGPRGRLVVADPDGIALDLVLPDRPVRNELKYGPAPHLLPAFRALQGTIGYLLAEVDRTGADVTVVDLLGTDADHVHVQGTHDVVHKVPGGQTSQRRMQRRAEDSWARNAAEVAKELDGLVARHRPATVLLAGDITAVGDVLDAASGQVKEIAVRLSSGGRGSGASVDALAAEVKGALAEQHRTATAGLVDRFNTAEGRQEAAVQSLEDVVDAARRMQIEELLLHDDPMSTLKLWVGNEPGQLGMRESDVRSLGATDPQQVRADIALVWALVYADSGITLLDQDQRDLEDGVGALLRYADRSTPHDEIYSMPGHGTNKGTHHRGE